MLDNACDSVPWFVCNSKWHRASGLCTFNIKNLGSWPKSWRGKLSKIIIPPFIIIIIPSENDCKRDQIDYMYMYDKDGQNTLLNYFFLSLVYINFTYGFSTKIITFFLLCFIFKRHSPAFECTLDNSWPINTDFESLKLWDYRCYKSCIVALNIHFLIFLVMEALAKSARARSYGNVLLTVNKLKVKGKNNFYV